MTCMTFETTKELTPVVSESLPNKYLGFDNKKENIHSELRITVHLSQDLIFGSLCRISLDRAQDGLYRCNILFNLLFAHFSQKLTVKTRRPPNIVDCVTLFRYALSSEYKKFHF